MAQAMPTLHYKYRMNEPFVNGEAGQYQVSHEQNEFKKRHVYGIGVESRTSSTAVKTAQEEIDEMKEEISREFVSKFSGKAAPDIHTLMVKQDQSDLFGLKITQRRCPQVNHLFDFDIEEYISFYQMRQMFDLPSDAVGVWDAAQWT